MGSVFAKQSSVGLVPKEIQPSSVGDAVVPSPTSATSPTKSPCWISSALIVIRLRLEREGKTRCVPLRGPRLPSRAITARMHASRGFFDLGGAVSSCARESQTFPRGAAGKNEHFRVSRNDFVSFSETTKEGSVFLEATFPRQARRPAVVTSGPRPSVSSQATTQGTRAHHVIHARRRVTTSFRSSPTPPRSRHARVVSPSPTSSPFSFSFRCQTNRVSPRLAPRRVPPSPSSAASPFPGPNGTTWPSPR